VILGSSRGLGAYLAKRLASDGWDVLGVGKRPANTQCENSGIRYLQADLAEWNALDPLLEAIRTMQPDLIVHSAVTYGTPGRPATSRDLETIFKTNALVPYQLIHTYLTDGMENACCIIIVNSDSIYHATTANGAYAASKAALRVLTTALAHVCKARSAVVATLLLGPLADERKRDELRAAGERRGMSEQAITQRYLERSNPFLAIDRLIDLESCYDSILYIEKLGRAANGMVCKMDGGSSGSLI
jgi:NAD(P)-dependent dehydrogenase (short-subunit alcohol dehydrogenase family)